jgi:hypothetical protein
VLTFQQKNGFRSTLKEKGLAVATFGFIAVAGLNVSFFGDTTLCQWTFSEKVMSSF